jgi:phosphate transport system substrate-binding protein
MAMRFKAAVAATAFIVLSAHASAEPVTLKETGSTLIEPLFRAWAADYAKSRPDVNVTTAGTGSGDGMAQAFSGAAQIGASDAYMTDDEASEHPGFVDVALAISAMTISYNLPDIEAPLKLDGPALAGIYMGAIRSWDDRAIATLNPGAPLPHHNIIPVHRADGSGDTFIFSQFLSFATTTREDDVTTVIAMPNGSWGDAIGYGTTISWPKVEGALEATGNDGMVETLGKTPYAIGYVGISFADKVVEAKLSVAAVRSYSGQFLQPTAHTIAAAAASLTPRTPPDERLTLVNAPGVDCYPLVNYEYAVVARRQADPKTAAAIRDFLQWAISPDEGNAKRLSDAHMIALPAPIWVESHDQIETIR